MKERLRIIISVFVYWLWLTITAECPNACSSHGTCGAYDMCSCYKNWMGNDCSLRMCQFGKAWVDIPKGDLDASGKVTGPSVTTIVNSQLYPFGVAERYPNMLDTQGNVLDNSAHAYAECSNKGYCDRIVGQCRCIVGYEGSACQRTVCPTYDTSLVCSGHGNCVSSGTIASMDYGNVYRMWDEDMTMGCVCEPGYIGSDCNQRSCKYGYDPVYIDKSGSWRFANWSLVLYTTSSSQVVGNYSLHFTDRTGKTWHTDPLNFNASCKDITGALERLPNRVVPGGSVLCVKWNNYHTITATDEPGYIASNPYYGVKYNLAFPKSPGVLAPLAIDTYLDGSRPTMYNSDASPVGAFVYSNGFSGETEEYFHRLCNGVDVNIITTSSYHYLSGLTNLETRLLQQCLGQANIGVVPEYTGTVKGKSYSWDYGTVLNPHLVRMVDLSATHVTDMCPGAMNSVRGGGVACTMEKTPGFIVPLYYDPTEKRFILMTRPGGDYSASTLFSIWFTDATTQLISSNVKAYTDTQRPYDSTIYTVNSTSVSIYYNGGVDCETSLTNTYGLLDCVDKGDILFFLDTSRFAANPKYMNLYEVKKIYNYEFNSGFPNAGPHRIVLNMPVNGYWNPADPTTTIRIFKFLPRTSYPYVAECSNRGLCDRTYGDCVCFQGYSLDDCSKIDNTEDSLLNLLTSF